MDVFFFLILTFSFFYLRYSSRCTRCILLIVLPSSPLRFCPPSVRARFLRAIHVWRFLHPCPLLTLFRIPLLMMSRILLVLLDRRANLSAGNNNEWNCASLNERNKPITQGPGSCFNPPFIFSGAFGTCLLLDACSLDSPLNRKTGKSSRGSCLPPEHELTNGAPKTKCSKNECRGNRKEIGN